MLTNKYILILLLVTSISSNGNILCLKQYEHLSLKQRFEKVVKENSNSYFPLTLANFLKAELQSLTETYETQIDTLKVGKESSNLKTELNLFRIQTTSLEKAIKDFEKVMSPSSMKKLFSTNKSRAKSLESEILSFKVCRNGFHKPAQ